ncbi:MAG: uncharacterized protein JWP04_1963 [Belnapia sp.]|nr:uncharacterized protein [Belnapia sp.]
MEFRVGCELSYRLQQPTPFLFNVEVAQTAIQTIGHEALTLTAGLPRETWMQPESNNRYLRVMAPAGAFTLRYEATVSLTPTLDDPASVAEVPAGELPFDVYPHLYPSRYCQADRLTPFAQRTFGALPPGYARVNGICNWIHDHVDYQAGSSDAQSSAMDTILQRAGVCRDFSHLAITLCRAMGIPARYVSAYAWRLDPPDFHAVFEAWLQGPAGGAWYVFDATRKAAPDGLIRIGVGRDAAEVAFASPFGAFEAEKPKVWIEAVGNTGALITTAAVRVAR